MRRALWLPLVLSVCGGVVAGGATMIVVGSATSCGGNNDVLDLGGGGPDLSLPDPTVLASAQTLTSCLAIDDQALYWADDSGGGSILKVAKGGGAVTTLVAGGVDNRACAVADATSIYYTSDGFQTVNRVSKTAPGGAPIAPNQHVLGNLAIDPSTGDVCWGTDVYGNVDAYNGMNAIVCVPAGGGGGSTPYSAITGDVTALVVSADAWFVSDASGVYAIAKSSSQKTTYGSSVGFKNNIFGVDPPNDRVVIVEVTGLSQGDIASYKLDGSGRVQVSNALASVLVLDAAGIYAKQGNNLVRIAYTGGVTTAIGAYAPRAIAVDATRVYFSDGVTIAALPK